MYVNPCLVLLVILSVVGAVSYWLQFNTVIFLTLCVTVAIVWLWVLHRQANPIRVKRTLTWTRFKYKVTFRIRLFTAKYTIMKLAVMIAAMRKNEPGNETTYIDALDHVMKWVSGESSCWPRDHPGIKRVSQMW